MKQTGLISDKGHVKSSRVVGEVMDKSHLHGGAAIYDALVRLVQPFNLRVPLVDGHGNFGSPDDGPAAARYIEARLAQASLYLVEGLGEDIVDFVPNYDNQFQQPAVLPAAFPNPLANGVNGIAVGVATNIPPHNVGETIAGAIHLLDHPDASLEDLMRLCPGSDLLGGGMIVGTTGIRGAYETGRGVFVTRVRATTEQVTARKRGIVVAELPYMVGLEKVIEKLKDAVSSGKIKGVSGRQDLSDRKNGLRLVIEVKTGSHPGAVLASLYKHTLLQESFGTNTVTLVNGEVKTLGLRAALQAFANHHIEATQKRSEFRLRKKWERLHPVDGLPVAVLSLDEVTEVIRPSDDSAVARARPISVFDLSKPQTEYILELKLRHLIKSSRPELEAEADELRAATVELEAVLASTEKLHSVVRRELQDVATTLPSPRRTLPLEEDGIVVAAAEDDLAPTVGVTLISEAPLEVTDELCRIVWSATGEAARIGASVSFKRPAGIPTAGSCETRTRGVLRVVTFGGFVVRFDTLTLPSVKTVADGEDMTWFFEGVPSLTAAMSPEEGETVVGILLLDEDEIVGIITESGVIKRIRSDYPSTQNRFPTINPDDTDQMVFARAAGDDAQFVLVSTDAQLLRTPVSMVHLQGRNAGGVAGVSLCPNMKVLAGVILSELEVVSTVVATVAIVMDAMPGANQSSVKLTPSNRYPIKGRGGQGVHTQRFLKGEYALGKALVGRDPVVVLGDRNESVVLPSLDERRDASGSALESQIVVFG